MPVVSRYLIPRNEKKRKLVVPRLRQSSYSSPEEEIFDPLNCCEVVIPISKFPVDLNLNLNCITVASSNSSQSSSSPASVSSYSSSNFSPASSNESVTTTSSCSNTFPCTSSVYLNSTINRIDEEDEDDESEFEDSITDVEVLNLSTTVKRNSEANTTCSTTSTSGVYEESNWSGQTHLCDEDDVDFDELDFDDFDLDDEELTNSSTNTNTGGASAGSNNSNTIVIKSNKLGISSVVSNTLLLHTTSTPRQNNEGAEFPSRHSTPAKQYLSFDNPNPVPCIHCQGGRNHLNESNHNVIWPIKLDVDLIKGLVQLVPEFFNDFDEVEMDPMELGGGSPSKPEDPTSQGTETDPQPSPPNVQVDDSPLHESMDRNKESLKVKLLLRRPMNQLVEQGILPPPKTPPAYAGQRVRLERAKMGDLLKAKIQQRPARQELIRQHILEDSDARVAPSLAEKQRMLKRARLADSLNDHLIHRPGPLELVQKNILHAPDAIIDQAIKEGVVPFKATSEGHIPGPHVPSNIYLSEDDSSSDLSSPAGTPDHSAASSQCSIETLDNKPETNVPKLGIVSKIVQQFSPADSVSSTTSNTSSVLSPPPPPLPQPQTNIQNELLSKIVKAAVTSTTTPPLTSAQLTLSKLSSSEHQQILNSGFNLLKENPPASTFPQFQQIPIHKPTTYTGKSRSSKKSSSKIKSQAPKTRQIKFHEYKGPPSAQKNNQQLCNSLSESETSYELLLQQQQLFLQWQLECRHKFPQIILPAGTKLATPMEIASTFASAVNPTSAAAITLHHHANTTVLPTTASFPNVLSPSTITSVQTPQQAMCGSPSPTATPITVQALVEKYNKSAASAVSPIPVPLKVLVSAPPPSPATESKQPELCQVKSSESSPVPPIIKPSVPTKLNDWKVSDLKAELKKRNLPVSGPKPQLIERLKQSDASLQDESISTTTTPTTKVDICSTNGDDVSNTDTIMMDTSSLDVNSPINNNTHQEPTSNLAALNAATLTLLQQFSNNNSCVIPATVLNALTNLTPTTIQNGKTQTAVVVDEQLVRDQQNIIQQLQQDLQNSQNQIQQMKLLNQQSSGTPDGQKHRIVLQQHIHQKIQQQALQAKLQELIQLATLQQQQQHASPGPKGTPNNTLQVIKPQKSQQVQIVNKLQKAGMDTIVIKKPQVAASLSSTVSAAKEGHVKDSEIISVSVPIKSVKIEPTVPEQQVSPVPCVPVVHKVEAFQISEELNTDGSNSHQEHSWLLKINEAPGPVTADDSRKGTVKEFANFFESIAHPEKSTSNREEPKVCGNTIIKVSKPKPKVSFQSQMVDDVLEILIRNGELPPSAAQVPQTPVTPGSSGSSPKIMEFNPQAQLSSEKMDQESVNSKHQILPVPPPPPPLPPATFAVTLPTSITFSRPTSGALLQFHPNHNTTSELSKEAQDILKISQDLSNFGKAHAEKEKKEYEAGFGVGENEDLGMLLDEVGKDMNTIGSNVPSCGDDMDVSVLQHFPNPFNHEQSSASIPMSVDSNGQKHNNLLEELGSFLPPSEDLDVSMPMEMDYSDWLENLLPEHTNGHISLSTSPNNTTTNLSNPHVPFFSPAIDTTAQHHFITNSQRDPLLSSRSMDVFGSNNYAILHPGDSDMKSSSHPNNPRAPSPMLIGTNENGLLWDFV